jgi:hypothetical protein
LGTILVASAVAIALQSPEGDSTVRAQSCAFSVSPTRIDLAAAAQSGTISVDTQDGCAWTVSVNPSERWIQLGVTGGTGPGMIPFTVAPLVFESVRQLPVSVRWNTPTLGMNVIVTQTTGPCTTSIYPGLTTTSPVTFGGLGGGAHVNTFAEPAFSGQWFFTSAPDWITFTQPPLGIVGRGDSAAFYKVEPNPGIEPRVGTAVFCNGQTLTIRQTGRSLRDGPYVAGDFDDDGVADLTVYRPSTGTWYVLRSRSRYSYADYLSAQWGAPTDIPIHGDFDGDKKTEIAIFRPAGTPGAPSGSNWTIKYSSDEYRVGTATTYWWPDPPGRSWTRWQRPLTSPATASAISRRTSRRPVSGTSGPSAENHFHRSRRSNGD